MSDDMDKALKKIERLMRFAEGNHNSEAEAQNALSLAQQLADAYNIDIAGVNTKAEGREEQIFPGGLYPYQRKLYEEIALLNHCLYWNRKGLQRGEKYKHRLVGSRMNVIVVKNMANYLQQAVERIARDQYHNDPKLYFKKEAHLFREGMVDRIIERMKAKRAEEVAEAERRKREEAARSSHPGAVPNALVLIDDVVLREKIANYNYQHGEGAWEAKEAREAAWREEWQRKRDEANAAEEKFRLEHPEEYARQQAEKKAENDRLNAKWQKKYEARERRREKTGYYEREAAKAAGSSRNAKYRNPAYHAGRSKGDEVSLNEQIGKEDVAKLR